MSDIVFLEPLFIKSIWGGNSIKNVFDHIISDEPIEEAWVISGHSEADLKIKNGKFKNMNLGFVYRKNKHLFGNMKSDQFPFLVRLIDVNEDLPLEVHAEVAKAFYVIKAQKGQAMRIGNFAQTKEEWRHKIIENTYVDLMMRKPLTEGDFIYIPAGTVYQLQKGVLLMEFGLSLGKSYNSIDHLDMLINSISLSAHEEVNAHQLFLVDGSKIIQYINRKAFTIEKWEIRDVLDLENRGFKMMSILSGKGFVNGTKIKKGEHFIILNDIKHLQLEGTMEIIVSYL
jgi:mannose-6-phosphate isomerase